MPKLATRWPTPPPTRPTTGTVAVVELRGDTSVVAGRPTIALDGLIDLATVPTLRDVLLRAVADHPDHTLVVDLDGVEVLDDAGLGVLLGVAGRLRERGHDLIVVAARPALAARLATPGFDRAVTVVSSLAAVPT